MHLENRDFLNQAWVADSHAQPLRGGDGQDISVPGRIDLRPLLSHQAAAEMLMLARGQLNRAFRTHGLLTPDPMLVADTSCVDPFELDDPAAEGFSHARSRHGDAFVAWTEEMPSKLARSVLEILRQALGQVPYGSGAAIAALTQAHDFLCGDFRAEATQPPG